MSRRPRCPPVYCLPTLRRFVAAKREICVCDARCLSCAPPAAVSPPNDALVDRPALDLVRRSLRSRFDQSAAARDAPCRLQPTTARPVVHPGTSSRPGRKPSLRSFRSSSRFHTATAPTQPSSWSPMGRRHLLNMQHDHSEMKSNTFCQFYTTAILLIASECSSELLHCISSDLR